MVTLKKYPVLPLYVVEDHNEVVPYIHRAIGSRHLPLTDSVLVHLDSHPDMLIPLRMPADSIFDKDTLYESVSIENWIIPLVYAGHTREIVWIKPPWCQQIQDKTLRFYVGKCLDTGTIRTTCKESYFVSEALYRPESSLVNKKLVTLTVVTLKPLQWTWCSQSNRDDTNLPRQSCTKDSSTECTEVLDKNNSREYNDITEQSEVTVESTLCTNNSYTANSTENISHENTDISLTENTDGASCNGQMVSTHAEKDKKSLSIDVVSVGDEKPSSSRTEYESVKRTKNNTTNSLHVLKKLKTYSGVKTNIQSNNKTEANFTTIMQDVKEDEESVNYFTSDFVDQLEKLFEGFIDKQVILDVDLDFFSTKNPFQVMYTEEQYHLLKELYIFTQPRSSSDKDIARCVKEREIQLDSLKSVWETLQCNAEEEIHHPKICLIRKLHSSLSESTKDPVDLELLHEAGCTCDDTELPHHVSNQEQITLLVAATQELLCRMKKPTIITMARSSNDDYCPPDQVNEIQESVLDMLKELYLEISVTEDYEIITE